MLVPKPLEAKNKVQITKHLEVEGMVIIGSKNVDDKAFYVAQEIILKITSKRPEIRMELIDFVCILVARGESIAAYLELDENDPNYKYGCAFLPEKNQEYPGYLASVVEWDGEPNMGVFVFVLACAINYAICQIDLNFYSSLEKSYKVSVASKTWDCNPRSLQDVGSYWAEGVRMWYYAGEFETRDALKEYDLGLAKLLGDWISDEDIPKVY